MDEGGLVYFARTELVDDVRTMSNFGFGTPRQATMPGLNGKFERGRALLRWRSSPSWTRSSGTGSTSYAAYWARCPQLWFQQSGTRQAHQFVPARVPGARPCVRDDLVTALAGAGVELGTYFSPHLAEQPYFADLVGTPTLPHTETVAAEIVSLPLSDDMDRRDVDAIAAASSVGGGVGQRLVGLDGIGQVATGRG